MKILLNGVWRETTAGDVATALHEFGYTSTVVATAVNGQFVAAAARCHAPLREGDQVEVLAPMQGG